MSSKCFQVYFSLTLQENAACTNVLSYLLPVTPEVFGMLGSLEAAPAVLRARGGMSQGAEEHIFLWEIHGMSEYCPVDGSQRYRAEARVGEAKENSLGKMALIYREIA